MVAMDAHRDRGTGVVLLPYLDRPEGRYRNLAGPGYYTSPSRDDGDSHRG